MALIKRRSHDEHSNTLPDNLHPVLRRIYMARNVVDAAELEHGLNRLLPYHDLKGINEAVTLLIDALNKNQRILIVGDFDADGATSSALAVRALRAMGATYVDFLVPNRFEYGYGLTPEIVNVALKSQPELIITVDNGISSLDGVTAAKSNNIQVLVTDHHLPGEQLPHADAIVNPNQPGDEFSSKNMAGVGVIFYVMMSLRVALREQGWFEQQGIPEPNLASYLDLVALGTVADVVPLDHNNRILVAQGLARIRAGECCPGIRAILEVAGRKLENISSTDMGFCVGPRLNAAGRLEDMSIGINCLLSDDMNQARLLAKQLDQLNHDRRNIEQDMREQAFQFIDSLQMDDEADLPVGMCLFNDEWHEGVIGILASRVKDKLHRPVIAFAPAGVGLIKGSARSVKGLHIRDALDSVAAKHPGLIHKFGGHAMAAGLTLNAGDYARFAQAFDEEVARHLTEEDLHGTIYSDGELVGQDINLQLAEYLKKAGPWGQGFPEPVFDGVFELVNRRIVGEKHLKLLLRAPGENMTVDAIAFNTVDHDWPTVVNRVQLAYRLDVNEFNKQRNAQLIVEQVEPV
ncbi:MAG: single-stranded-DNA-specific exonuclease RecJ [Gammaproteobacteria bacterium]|nr:single-stranded-DNA-specific exonuclease RecJ [Gammaproteobacteria bacterium]